MRSKIFSQTFVLFLGLNFLVANVNADSYSFTCHGTEPFWYLTLHDGEMSFKSIDQDHPLVVKGETRSFAGAGAAMGLTLGDAQNPFPRAHVLQTQNCNDGMSDETYEYAVVYDTAVTSFIGCCQRNVPAVFAVRNVRAGDKLNVRESPSIEASVLGQVELNDQLVNFGCRGEWCRIKKGDLLGWSHKRYLVENKEEANQ